MSADELFAEAARRGLRLCNLFQFNETEGGKLMWRANWTRYGRGFRFGEAETPQGALQTALAHVTDDLDSDDMELIG